MSFESLNSDKHLHLSQTDQKNVRGGFGETVTRSTVKSYDDTGHLIDKTKTFEVKEDEML